MTFIAAGVAIPNLGFAVQHSLVQGRTGPEVRKRHLSVDPLRLRSHQGERIDVDWEHGNALVGEVTYLELDRGGNLWAIATMRGAMPDSSKPVYWSVRALSDHTGGDVVLKRVAVVADPAMIGARPLVFLDGELREHNLHHHWRVDGVARDVLTRAVAASARRGAILVDDADPARAEARDAREYRELQLRGGPPGPLHYGPRGRVISVR